MRTREVTDYKRRLDNLFVLFNKIPFDEYELKSHWARYLCVVVSGFIEVSVRAIYIDFSRRKASVPVANYVDSKLSRLQNVSMAKLLQLTMEFSPTWEASLRAATDGELGDAVDSIVSLRNQIAHGQNAGVSFNTVFDYYQRVQKVVELLEQQCA